MVYSGTLVYGRSRWASALRGFEAWSRDAADEVTVVITFITPPAWMEMGEEPLMLLGFAWSDQDFDRAAQVVGELRAAAPPDAESTELTGWTAWQSAVDGLFPKGVRAYWKNTSFDRLDDDVISTIIRHGAEQTWQGTAFDIHLMGGAYGRIAEDETAFPGRSSRFWLNIYGFWDAAGDDAARTAFVRGFAKDMAPFSTGREYVNFMGLEDAGRRTSALDVYGTAKLARLVALKQRFDPEDLFRLNHNVEP
ncbi:BBE domain-containing protein [Paeniglutamicibacter psychrophenolicus]|uniref:BBE domain-containing protein n=1 Tax=Paeniglutamicibacter psychrophenolicus TaxID=257454 RepID=UPI003159FD5E